MLGIIFTKWSFLEKCGFNNVFFHPRIINKEEMMMFVAQALSKSCIFHWIKYNNPTSRILCIHGYSESISLLCMDKGLSRCYNGQYYYRITVYWLKY